MNKVRIKTWDEVRAELSALASRAELEAFDRALAEGRKVNAVKLARAHGIAVEES